MASSITQRWTTGRVIWSVLFWLWGFGGFISVLGMFSGVGLRITVGDSAYLAACALFWIGGMMLFGLSAILCAAEYRQQNTQGIAQPSMQGVPSNNPEFPQVHRGIPYRVESDGSVVVSTKDGARRYKTWNEFWSAVGG